MYPLCKTVRIACYTPVHTSLGLQELDNQTNKQRIAVARHYESSVGKREVRSITQLLAQSCILKCNSYSHEEKIFAMFMSL